MSHSFPAAYNVSYSVGNNWEGRLLIRSAQKNDGVSRSALQEYPVTIRLAKVKQDEAPRAEKNKDSTADFETSTVHSEIFATDDASTTLFWGSFLLI